MNEEMMRELEELRKENEQLKARLESKKGRPERLVIPGLDKHPKVKEVFSEKEKGNLSQVVRTLLFNDTLTDNGKRKHYVLCASMDDEQYKLYSDVMDQILDALETGIEVKGEPYMNPPKEAE